MLIIKLIMGWEKMYKGIIFDLDETIVNSTSLKDYRDSRDWKSCYSNTHLTTIYEGLDNLQTYIRQQNLKVGIVTMSPKSYAKRLLAYHSIHFDNLIAYHDVKKRKPHPEPMIKCAMALGIQPNELISLGDDKRDIESANSAAITSVGVTWGCTSKEELLTANPDYIIDDINQLYKLL